MRETTKEGRTGIQWTLMDMCDDLDFADDLALLSHSIKQNTKKTACRTGYKCDEDQDQRNEGTLKGREGGVDNSCAGGEVSGRTF